MAALLPTDAASTVVGANGTLYYFALGLSDIQEVIDVSVFLNAGTTTDIAVEEDTYEAIYKLLHTTDTITGNFHWFFADNILYVFVKTASVDTNNRFVLSWYRDLARATADTDTFDAYPQDVDYVVVLAYKMFLEGNREVVPSWVTKFIKEHEDNIIEGLV